MKSRVLLSGVMLASLCGLTLHADEALRPLQGTCRISASTRPNDFDLKLLRGQCEGDRDCHEDQTQEPMNAFSGVTAADLQREGSQLRAVLTAEAGTLTCSGSVHNAELSGDFVFDPNQAFVTRMRGLGIHGDIDSQKMEAYALFRVETSWIESLQKAGVGDIDTDNLIALRIFKVDAAFIQSLNALGYPTPSAEKLIGLRVQGVEPAEVKRFRAMGYQPTLDELIQMRIFKVTPDFITRMQARGFKDLTIAKLVQIRIFKLAD